MMPTLYKVPVLRIKQCPDAMRWYRGHVGQLVPHMGWSASSGYRSTEPDGFSNFVLTDDAEPVEIVVSKSALRRWPYRHAGHQAVPVDFPEPAPTPTAKRCADHCGRLGICQALEDCADQPRIDAQLQPKTTHNGQSRMHSAAETMTSIAIGFAVSMALQAVVLPLYGHHITLGQNFQITVIFTVASLLRSYGVRRFFNRLQRTAT